MAEDRTISAAESQRGESEQQTPPLIAQLHISLRDAADPTLAPGMQAYMKSSMPYLGVRAPIVQALVRDAVREHPITGTDDLAGLVRTLFDEATHREHRYAALTLLRLPRHRKLLDPTLLPLMEHIAVHGAWWDVVDSVAKPVGFLLLDHRRAVEPVIRGWIASPDRWLRRLAIICQLGHGSATDTDLLTEAIEAAQDESEFFLRKAIGWALREYARTDPAWVIAFVEGHPRLSGLSRRETLKHL